MKEIKITVDILMDDGRIMRGFAVIELSASIFEDNVANATRLAETVVHNTFTKLSQELKNDH